MRRLDIMIFFQIEQNYYSHLSKENRHIRQNKNSKMQLKRAVQIEAVTSSSEGATDLVLSVKI